MRSPTHEPALKSLLLVLAVMATAGGTLSATAQNAETIKRFEKEEHTGPVEQALVGIEVTNQGADGKKEVFHGNGFVLRCDGFILAPRGLFEGRMQGGHLATSRTVVVILHPGEAHEIRVSTPPPRFEADIAYLVFKLNNVHLPALRTLLTTALKPGDPLQLVFSRWNETTGHFQPVEHLTTALAKSPVDSSKVVLPLGTHFMGTVIASIPAGSALVGPDGMGVGVVPGASVVSNPSTFLSFDLLHLATNCVSPVPTTDAQFAESKLDTGEMIAIPGGPVSANWVMSGALQQDMAGATVACVAPFKIDKDEVTNARYLQFWKALTDAERKELRWSYYPAGWDDTDPPFSEDLATTPVLGVTQAGAMAYARWAGKRLLTPYEWCLAAMGRGVSDAPAWMADYIKERNEVVSQVRKAHLDYVKNNPVMDAADFMPKEMLPKDSKCDGDPTHVHGYDFLASWSAPWIAYSESTTFFGPRDGYGLTDFPGIPKRPIMIDPVVKLASVFMSGKYDPGRIDPQASDQTLIAAEWSKKTVQDLTDPLLEKWKDPGAVLPIGSRSYDVNRYGVRDMAMNARELVLASPFPISTYVGRPCVMGVGWSEAEYPAAAYEPPGFGSLTFRQGAFLHGTGRDGMFVARLYWLRGGGWGIRFPPGGRVPWTWALPGMPEDYMPPPVVPISRLVGRTTDWPPPDLLMAGANLWETTAMLSQLNGPYLVEEPITTQRNRGQIFDRLDFPMFQMHPVGALTFSILDKSASPMGTPLGMPIGLKMWVEKPRHPHQEIARQTLPLEKTGPQRSLEGSLYYVPPIGFRCAR